MSDESDHRSESHSRCACLRSDRPVACTTCTAWVTLTGGSLMKCTARQKKVLVGWVRTTQILCTTYKVDRKIDADTGCDRDARALFPFSRWLLEKLGTPTQTLIRREAQNVLTDEQPLGLRHTTKLICDNQKEKYGDDFWLKGPNVSEKKLYF